MVGVSLAAAHRPPFSAISPRRHTSSYRALAAAADRCYRGVLLTCSWLSLARAHPRTCSLPRLSRPRCLRPPQSPNATEGVSTSAPSPFAWLRRWNNPASLTASGARAGSPNKHASFTCGPRWLNVRLGCYESIACSYSLWRVFDVVWFACARLGHCVCPSGLAWPLQERTPPSCWPWPRSLARRETMWANAARQHLTHRAFDPLAPRPRRPRHARNPGRAAVIRCWHSLPLGSPLAHYICVYTHACVCNEACPGNKIPVATLRTLAS